MYNVRALRCKVNMENHINLLWRRSQASDQPSWSIWLPVSGVTTVCRLTSNSSCSRLLIIQGPALCSLSSLKLVLQASGQKSFILLLNSSLSCVFFSCIIDTYGFSSLSPFSIGSLTYVFSSSRASSIVLSMQLNMK